MTVRGRDYSQPVRNALWATAGNQCAFPDCERELVVLDGSRWVTVGDIAHIAGVSPGGPRYDSSLRPEQVRGFDNLLLLCNMHHRIVDVEGSRHTSEQLREFKRIHLSKFGRPVVGLQDGLLAAPPLSSSYVERSQADTVAEMLRSRGHLVVAGLSGCGKTQLAAHLFRHLADEYTLRWWVRGSSDEVFEGDMVQIGLQLGVEQQPGEDRPSFVRRIVGRLEEMRGWLMVVDDAPSSDVVAPIGGVMGGAVLITSQNSGWFGHEVVSLEPFTSEESLTLLRPAFPSERDDDLLLQIAAACHYHPLAIVQAASFATASGMTAQDFIFLTQARHADLLANGLDPYHASLAASVTASYELLSPNAQAIASMLAMLAPVPIDLPEASAPELGEVDEAYPLADAVHREASIAELRAVSFVEREGRSISMHALVRELINGRSDRSAQGTALAHAITTLMILLPERSDSPAAWPRMEALLPHILALLNKVRTFEKLPIHIVSTLYIRLAGFHHAQGRSDIAEEMLNELRASVEHLDDENSRGTLASVLNNLANIHAERGLRDLAYVEYNRAIEIKEAVYGPAHYLTGVAYAALASFLTSKAPDDIRARESAKQLHLKALAAYRTDDRPEWICDCLIDLAEIAIDEGDKSTAETYIDEALQLASSTPELWEEHSKALLTQARLYEEQGDLAQAATAARMAANAAKEHAEISLALGRALGTHGRLLTRTGTISSGRTQLRRAVAVMEQVEPEHVDLARAKGNLGWNLISTPASYQEGIRFLRESEEYFVARLPRGHRSINIAQVMLLDAYMQSPLPPIEEVRQLVERMLEQTDDDQGREHLRTLLAALDDRTASGGQDDPAR